MKKGFTLIELLIVISILAILSSVVLANMSASRAKGNESAVKVQLANIKARAGIELDNNSGNYGRVSGSCPLSKVMSLVVFQNSVPIIDLFKEIAKTLGVTGGAFPSGVCRYAVANDSYAILVKLNSGKWTCVDSFGAAKDYTTLPTSFNNPDCAAGSATVSCVCP